MLAGTSHKDSTPPSDSARVKICVRDADSLAASTLPLLGVGGQAGVDHLGDERVALQVLRQLQRILAVAFHAQSQCLGAAQH
jgi:hypothetical protein